jgi:hypothetical protein
MPKKSNIGFSFDWKSNVLTASANEGSGDDREQLASRTFDIAALPVEVRDRLSQHGLQTLLQQRVSQVPVDNYVERLDAMVGVYDRLEAGEWEAERQVGARTISPEVELIMQLKKCAAADAGKAFKALTAEQQMAFKTKYADKLAAIRESRKEAAPVDLTDVL